VLTDPVPGARARLAQLDAAILDTVVHGLEPVRLDGLLLAPTGVPHEQWNGAWFFAPVEDLATTLREAAGHFGRLGVRYGLVVPHEQEAALDGALTAAGAKRLFPLRLMERRLEEVPAVFPPPGVRIRRAAGRADFEALLKLQAACFQGEDLLWSRYLHDRYEHPEIEDFLAVTPEDDVVGAGTLVRTGLAAGVYGIGVSPRWRRQGVGAALTGAVLAAGARRGCRIAHLNPSESGIRTYRRLGFTDVPGFSVWAPPDRARRP
jgi:GNAT superfamily N-acetyltransferase